MMHAFLTVLASMLHLPPPYLGVSEIFVTFSSGEVQQEELPDPEVPSKIRILESYYAPPPQHVAKRGALVERDGNAAGKHTRVSGEGVISMGQRGFRQTLSSPSVIAQVGGRICSHLYEHQCWCNWSINGRI